MRSWNRLSAIAALVMLAAAGAASASPAGGAGHGGGGGGHFAGGGFHGGGFHGGYGGWHGGYGWRGGYYGPYGWCCGWGWGWGWGLGFYLPFLPWYYDTYWWGGIPYYYADGNYYLWDGAAGAYEVVEPPSGLSSVPPQGVTVNPAVSSELFAYPKGGQSEAQQKQDKDECRRWATSETGFDPAAPAPGKGAGATRQSYLRAEAACLEARNYSVR